MRYVAARRHVRLACCRASCGCASSTLLWQVRRGALEYTRRGVIAAHDVVQACNTALMLLHANLVDLRNVFDIFKLIIDTEGEMALDVDVHHPTIAQKKEFSEYRRQVEILRGLLAENKNNSEAFQNLLAYQAQVRRDRARRDRRREAGDRRARGEEGEPRSPTSRTGRASRSCPSPSRRWISRASPGCSSTRSRSSTRNPRTSTSSRSRRRRTRYRSRQKLKYPDGTTVEDTGRAHVDGYTEFKLLNITPGRPVVILRRMDYVYGDYELELGVNGKKVSVVSCVGTDRVHRWRNWPALIAAEHVTDGTLLVRQQSITAGRDINMFHIWVYQPK